MNHLSPSVALLISTLLAFMGGVHGECLETAPPTVYESEQMSPQNMDYDRENKMFPAHIGWYNDHGVHYYKFRMYTPSTYPGLIVPGGSSKDVPIQKIYFVTTTGGFDGSVGKPIIEYHTSDGNVYSDFMEVHFVTAPADYVKDTFKSVSDITDSGAEVNASGIILNLPIVPTGSSLQHPELKGTAKAPIDPIPVWYKCAEVWTYLFEVTDQSAADFFEYTRTGPDPNDPAFSVYVKPFATSESVSAIPLIHVNQYSNGVVEGVNGGGPSPAGMRNVINLDRPDEGYSPLWHIIWATELPINYSADDASNLISFFNPTNGFETFSAPMYVNCPDIGAVDKSVKNPAFVDAASFEKSIDTSKQSNIILGSHQSTIMQMDIPVSFQTSDGSEIAFTSTNMMGAYELELMSSDIPEGTTEISIVVNDMAVRTIPVLMSEASDTMDTSTGEASKEEMDSMKSSTGETPKEAMDSMNPTTEEASKEEMDSMESSASLKSTFFSVFVFVVSALLISA